MTRVRQIVSNGDSQIVKESQRESNTYIIRVRDLDGQRWSRPDSQIFRGGEGQMVKDSQIHS